MVIMLTMQVSFALLEGQHVCTTNVMSSAGNGLTWVGGGFTFFVELKLTF